MSSFLRPTENKKTKNYTYHNSINYISIYQISFILINFNILWKL